MENPKFKCPRCGSGMNIKCNFKSHISRKKQCEAHIDDLNREELLVYFDTLGQNTKETPFQCKGCKKYYSNKKSLIKHIDSHCPHTKKKDDVTISSTLLKQLLEGLKIIEELKTQKPSVTHVSNTNIAANITNTTNNIILNCFTMPSLKHLPADLLTDCILQQDLPTVIENVYYDIEVPENRSIRYDDNGSYSLYEDGKWKKNNDIISELFDQSFRILSHHRRENKEEVEPLMNYYAKNWFDAIIDRESEVINPIMNDIKVSLADNKAILKHTK